MAMNRVSLLSIVKRSGGMFHYLLFGLSLILNVALIVRVGRLESERPAARTSSNPLVIGDIVPAIDGVGPDGKNSTLSLADQKVGTVIYVFTPTCPWCERNWQNMHALA